MTLRKLLAAVLATGLLVGCADDGSDEQAAGPTPQLSSGSSNDDAPTTSPTAPESGSSALASSTTQPTAGVIVETTTATTFDSTESSIETDDGTDDPTDAGTDPTAEPAATVPPDPTAEPAATAPPVPGATVTVDVDEQAEFGTGVTASIVDVEAVEVEARLPGERSGPGVVLTVEVVNGTDEAITLDFVSVDLIGDDGASALPVELAEPDALSGELEPSGTAVGHYQFLIPLEQRDAATVAVSYSASAPTLLFTGGLLDA